MKRSGVKNVLLIILIIIVLSFILIYINHNIQLKKEEKLFKPLGEMVTIDGKQMSVYTEGTGDETIVFMSGGGTSSPILDFKSLYSLLSDKYKIIVVEKFGYGFSDVVDRPRDIDTILEDTREALLLAGHKGPYILAPHSMSGIEALYWANKYPQEVKAIIGLDMALPKAYESLKFSVPMLKLGSIAASLGITRIIPDLSQSEAIKFGTLTEQEKEIYRAVFFRRTGTKTMINELKSIKDNAKRLEVYKFESTPTLLFQSNGEQTGFDKDSWSNIQKEFANINKSKQIILDAPHYIHNHAYKYISEEIEKFIESIK